MMQHQCEHCGHRIHEDEAIYMEDYDEYWCEPCADNQAEADWQRQQDRLMEEGPGPSLAEQQAEARKLK